MIFFLYKKNYIKEGERLFGSSKDNVQYQGRKQNDNRSERLWSLFLKYGWGPVALDDRRFDEKYKSKGKTLGRK